MFKKSKKKKKKYLEKVKKVKVDKPQDKFPVKGAKTNVPKTSTRGKK